MFDFIPERWRQAVGHLRDDIHRTLDRWLHRDHTTPEAVPGTMMTRPTAEIATHQAWRLPSLFAIHDPAIDIHETDDDVIVTAEMPGFERDDFSVEVTGERLVIRGQKKQAMERKEQGFTYSEQRYGAFARALQLPCEIDADKVQARYKNGVLRMTLPKTARAKARRITVKVVK